jgi:hypothetical protein
MPASETKAIEGDPLAVGRENRLHPALDQQAGLTLIERADPDPGALLGREEMLRRTLGPADEGQPSAVR